MRRLRTLVTIAAACSVYACDRQPAPGTARADHTPAAEVAVGPDSLRLSSGDVVYVPTDVSDALAWLDANLPPSVRQWLQDADELHAVAGLSRFPALDLRDRWGLASGSRLARSLEALGLTYPDAMATLVVTSFWRQLHDRPLRVDEQAGYLQRTWESLPATALRGFPACPEGAEFLPGVYPGRRTYLHVARCPATGELWAYEPYNGWFRPDSTVIEDYQGRP